MMTLFHPISHKVFKSTPKIIRIDDGGFRVLGGIRFASRRILCGDDNLKGAFYSLDLFGIRFVFRVWFEKNRENRTVIIFRNDWHARPAHKKVSIEWHEHGEFSIQPAYSGYLENNDRP